MRAKRATNGDAGRAAPAVIAAGVAAGLAVGSAHGQLVTPPPPARPVETYTPPPPPPPPEPVFDPSAIEFTPIYTRDADGKIVGPDGPPEIASLRNNPLIPEDLWPVVEALLEERAARYDLRVVQNPRLAVRLAAGETEEFDVSDTTTIERISELARALGPEAGPVREIAMQGVITEDMSQMSMYIWRDYSQAQIAEFVMSTRDSEDENAALNLQSRFLLRVSMAEALEAFDRVARRALEAEGSDEAKRIVALQGEAFRAAAVEYLGAMDDDTLRDTLTAGVR
ncbi:MAG: hypothetical protein ACTS22_08375 [Phycisphaerales bacterium]